MIFTPQKTSRRMKSLTGIKFREEMMFSLLEMHRFSPFLLFLSLCSLSMIAVSEHAIHATASSPPITAFRSLTANS